MMWNCTSSAQATTSSELSKHSLIPETLNKGITMSDLQILIQEIARIALEDDATMRRIGHELDVSDEELQRVGQYLNSLLDETNPTK